MNRALSRSLFLVGLLFSLQAPNPGGASQPIDRAAFAAPPMSARSLVRWWWPGGDVDDAELARELSLMFAAGFGGAEIQSFAVGLPTAGPAAIYSFASPAWFDHVAAALDHAQSLGMTIDLTLGSSWPSGGDSIDAAHSLQQLTSSAAFVEGPATGVRPVPGAIEPFGNALASALLQLPHRFVLAKMELATVLGLRLAADQTAQSPPASSVIPGLPDLPPTVYLDPTSVVDLTALVTPEGTLEWDVPAGDWLIFAFYAGPTGSLPFYSANPGGGLVLDHLNAAATDLQLQGFGQAVVDRFGGHVGSTLRSIFIDSLELRTNLYWTDDFLDEFAARRGYRLELFLPVLFESLQSDAYMSKVYPDAPASFEMRGIGPRARWDYDQTVSELMIERFFAPVGQWAEANALDARIQAHGAPVDLLAAYGEAGVPEAESLFAGGRRSFLKWAVSAANLLGKPIVSSEALIFRTGDPIVAPGAMLRDANRQLAAGVNQLVLHAFPYVYDTDFQWPGWSPFDSPHLPANDSIGPFATHLNDRNPFWRFLRDINDYLARAQLVLRTGQPVSGIALYAGRSRQADDGNPDPEINRHLEQSGYDFDYVGDELLLTSASVVAGKLHIGANEYAALVLPNIQQMPLDVAQQTAGFAQDGLPIVFAGDVPERSPGWLNFPTNDALVRAVFEGLFGADLDMLRLLDSFQTESALFVSQLTEVCGGLMVLLQVEPELFVGPTSQAADACSPAQPAPGDGRVFLDYVHRRSDSADYYLLANSGDELLEMSVSFPIAAGRIPEIWDLHTGEVDPALVYTQQGDRTKLALRIAPETAVVVGFEQIGSVFHVEGADAPIARLAGGDEIGLQAPAPGTYAVTLDGGAIKNVSIDTPSLPVIPMPNWNVLIALGRDASGQPLSQVFPNPVPGDLRALPGMLGFSGAAVYFKIVDLHPAYVSLPGIRLVLDLGELGDVAEVRINGALVATSTHAPHAVDVSDHLVAGLNNIVVVTSSSPTSAPTGLLGPVRLVPQYTIGLGFLNEP